MNTTRAGIAYLLITTVICLALDLFTKSAAVHHLSPPEAAIEFIPGYLHFTYLENRGAVFGVGQGMRWLFVLVSLGAIGFVAYMFVNSPRRWWHDVLLGMLLAGILGNLYDRLVFGYVRDMIHALPGHFWGGTWQVFGYPPEPDRAYFPWVFNVADSLLCVSIAMLIVAGIFLDHGKKNEVAAERVR